MMRAFSGSAKTGGERPIAHRYRHIAPNAKACNGGLFLECSCIDGIADGVKSLLQPQ
jgi:hypothetical protein